MLFRLTAGLFLTTNFNCAAWVKLSRQAFHTLVPELLSSLFNWPFITWLGGLSWGRGPACDWEESDANMCQTALTFWGNTANKTLLCYLSSRPVTAPSRPDWAPNFDVWSPTPVPRRARRPFCKHKLNLHPRKTFWPLLLWQTESGLSTPANVCSLMITCHYFSWGNIFQCPKMCLIRL